MKFTKKPLLAGGVALGIAGGAFLYQGTDLVENVQASAAGQAQLIEEAELTEAEAQEIALGEVAGEVNEVEAEKEGGTIVFEFEIATDTEVKEVEVDGNTGEVLGVEIDDEENEAEDDEEEAAE